MLIISSITLLEDSLLLVIYNSKALEKAKKFNSLVEFKGYLVKIAMIFRTSSSFETTKVDLSPEVNTSPIPNSFRIVYNRGVSSTCKLISNLKLKLVLDLILI